MGTKFNIEEVTEKMTARFFVMVAAVITALFILITHAFAGVNIVVDVSEQTMYVDTPSDSFAWKVSTARPGYHTPRGTYQPYRLEPIHYSKKYDNAPMPNSIFFNDGYAIHATYATGKLGSPASHGCVRLSPQNAKWLYRLVSEYGKDNTTITIRN